MHLKFLEPHTFDVARELSLLAAKIELVYAAPATGVYMYMYIYIYVCVYIYIYICINIYIHIYKGNDLTGFEDFYLRAMHVVRELSLLAAKIELVYAAHATGASALFVCVYCVCVCVCGCVW